jgi:tRNA(Arg) A34 adenosine deaminase TadA
MRSKLLRQCLQIAVNKNRPDLHPEWGNHVHFCFVVQGNKIVEWGTNRPGNADRICGFNPIRHKIHAEVDAYRKAKGLLNKRETFEVVNIRLNKDGKTRLAAPCSCCTNFLDVVGCDRVYFSTNVGWESISRSEIEERSNVYLTEQCPDGVTAATQDSKSCPSDRVRVRVSLRAPRTRP